MMDTMKAFLESSTIHGLSYMSTNRKYARLFWTFVVISGFSAAIILIFQSFQAWSSSPITTTIETLSITDITFPKVTVCPPKNTYTNLNYDLKMISNLTLDEDYRKELSYLALEVINDITFEDLMKKRIYFWHAKKSATTKIIIKRTVWHSEYTLTREQLNLPASFNYRVCF